MSRLNRRRAWIFAALITAGILAIAGVRLLSGRHGAPRPAEAGGAGLVAADNTYTGGETNLADLARRVRTFQDDLNRTRNALREAETESATLRERVAVLDDMLARDALTDCPVFLYEETTVRALQGILREATESRAPSSRTGEMIARQRLRGRLSALREEMVRQEQNLDARADALRSDLRRQADEVERLQRLLMSRIPPSKTGKTPSGTPAP